MALRHLTRPNDIIKWLRGTILIKLSRAESFGKPTFMNGKIHLRFYGQANFGDRFDADGRHATILIAVHKGGRLTVGNDVYMNGGVWIDAHHDIRIGNNVLFAPFVSLIDDNCHDLEPGSNVFKGPLIIGNNVWLGRNAVVMPGVRIGDGSVIGANSVVTRDIPPSTFAAGVPATAIRQLEQPEGWIRDLRFAEPPNAAFDYTPNQSGHNTK